MRMHDVTNEERREVVVDVLATTLYEMIVTGWQPRAARPVPSRDPLRAGAKRIAVK